MTTVANEVTTISRLDAIQTILQVLRQTTGLRIALVARITAASWTACAVLDEAGFGLKPGDELDLSTTYWHTVSGAVAPLIINRASRDERFKNHPGFQLYGIESYIAVPLFRRDGSAFGTLCALDPLPQDLNESHLENFHLLAKLISFELEAEDAQHRQTAELRETERIGKVREEMLGILSHDLRNPLNAISMATKLLSLKDNLDDKDKKAVRNIASSAVRMKRMVGDLLDLTRERLGGGLPVEREPHDLILICAQILEELKTANPNRQMVFSFEGDCGGEFDEERIAQVVSNLVGNALAYGAANAPVVVELNGDGEKISLIVNNQGEPIAPETLPILFEPFRRAITKQKSSDGLGLGLYIAAQIVAAHNGNICVESNWETGTTFTIKLPRC